MYEIVSNRKAVVVVLRERTVCTCCSFHYIFEKCDMFTHNTTGPWSEQVIAVYLVHTEAFFSGRVKHHSRKVVTILSELIVVFMRQEL